jgi:outer membrane protein OmpA-like peptidoglycan-associated protein
MNKMKSLNLIGTILLSGVLLAGVTGCRHPKTMVTPIPGSGGPPQPPPNNNLTPGNPALNPNPPVVSPEPIPLATGAYTPLFEGPHNEDTEKFKADTIHFDFDSSVIKPSEEPKLQDLANYFKENTRFEGLLIDGNCDERGTEKYNLSLGERRSLAAREYLVNLGVKSERIKTRTWGKSRPIDPGHDESAWQQNRRDDFVLVTPK